MDQEEKKSGENRGKRVMGKLSAGQEVCLAEPFNTIYPALFLNPDAFSLLVSSLLWASTQMWWAASQAGCKQGGSSGARLGPPGVWMSW